MDLEKKVAIVTGGGRGIGRALAIQFAGLGAHVIVADIDQGAAEAVAREVDGLGLAADVTRESDVQSLVAAARERYGPIDLFCSNAGVCLGEGEHAASATNDVWQLNWNVHVMAHVYAARAVLPDMIARGDGYLVQMASAAGLLAQIGDAAYSASKHAAVSFAESLAISHADDGVKVSVVCPQYVATPMLGYGDSAEDGNAPGRVLSAEAVAEAVAEGIADETFLILPHPQVAKFATFKAGSRARWLAAMRKLRRGILDEAGTLDVAKMHRLV